MPRQVISVINGMSQLFSGVERRRAEGQEDRVLLSSLCFVGAGELLSSWAWGNSALLQTGEVSVKHPKKSQVPSSSAK